MPTERDLLDALWKRLGVRTNNGMPRRYVMAEQVRYDPTQGGTIADAVALDTWGSGHWQIEGYEVKCNRSDYRRELPGDGAKSLPWRQHCSRWYIVAPSGILAPGDLLPGWGLIEYHAGALRSRVRATNTPDVLPLPPRAIAGLMRAVQQTAEHHAVKAYDARHDQTPGRLAPLAPSPLQETP